MRKAPEGHWVAQKSREVVDLITENLHLGSEGRVFVKERVFETLGLWVD